MFEKIRNLFAADAPPVVQKQEEVLFGDAAWGGGMLYQGASFPTYNPDDLQARKGVKIYQKMMLDEQIKAVSQFRMNSITGRKHFFEMPHTDDLDDEEKMRRVMLFDHILDEMPGTFKLKLDSIMSAGTLGFSLTEKVFKTIDFKGSAQIGIESLRTKPAETFVPYFDEFDKLIRLTQVINGHTQELDINNFVHHVNNPNVSSFYGQSELREAYRAYFSKDIAIRFYNMWLERMAGGFIWAQPREGVSLTKGSNEYNNLRNAMDSIRNNTRMIVPSGIELNIETPSDTQAFERAITVHDKSMAKALLVPNLLGLSEQGSVGSNAQSQTQLEAFLWDLDAQANYLESTLNKQLFKKLGDLNFDDGHYPAFRFKRLSFEQVKAMVSMWSDLTGKSVVESTIEDENFMRNLIDVPVRVPAAPAEGEAEVTRQDTALNGAQVKSMLGITLAVADGTLQKQAAIQMLITAYPVTLDRAQAIINPIEVQANAGRNDQKGSQNKGQEGQTQGQEGQTRAPQGKNANQNQAADQRFSKAPHQQHDHVDHGGGDCASGHGHHHDGAGNVNANSRLNFTAHRAARRVDFSSMGRGATVIEATRTELLANAVMEMANEMVQTSVLVGDTAPDISTLNKIKAPTNGKRDIRKVAVETATEAWKLGQTHAELEIKKAMASNRVRMSKINFAHIESDALKFINMRGFSIAGDISSTLENIIRNEVMAGIQYTYSQAEVAQNIYNRMVTKGLADGSQVPEEFINEKLIEISPYHRLETITRNNTFSAMNSGRDAFFLDPALDGFVQAFEYSSILDDATTPICFELGGGQDKGPFIRAADDPIWLIYSAQNHHNCRGLKIAIVEGDEYTLSEWTPDNTPQEGFGG